MTITDKIPKPCPCRKVGADEYIDIRDGTVHNYKRQENRGESQESLKRSMGKLRDLINCNADYPERIRWVTLTYRENMQDTKRLYDDYKAFWKRFQYWLKKNGYEKAEYITVIEPQARGAWHIHGLFIWPGNAPYVPNKALSTLWGQGYVRVTACDEVDNLGAYLTAYLADIPMEELRPDDPIRGDPVKHIEKNGSKKAIVKGGRLHLYPPGVNFYRTSRGVKRPVVEKCETVEAQKKVSHGKLTYRAEYSIAGDDGSWVNRIARRQYNMRQEKSK